MKKFYIKEHNRYWAESNRMEIEAENIQEALNIAAKSGAEFCLLYDEDGEDLDYTVYDEDGEEIKFFSRNDIDEEGNIL